MPIISVGSCIAALGWQWTFLHVDPDIIALVGESETIFAFLLGILLLRERTSWHEIAILCAMLVGLYFVISVEEFAPPLVTAVLLVVGAWLAIQSYIVKRYTKNLDGFSFSVIRVFIMTVALGCTLIAIGKIEPLPLAAYPLFGAIQFTGFILWRALYFQAHNYLPISVIYPITILDAVSILVISWVFLGIPVTTEKAIGAVLVIGGLFFFTREQIRLKSQAK